MLTRKQIREYIECPELGYTHYGKWGALTWEQRKAINDLLDILDSADAVILNLQQELTDYKERNEKAIEYVKGLRERYFRMCVAGSTNELSELIEILDKKDKE